MPAFSEDERLKEIRQDVRRIEDTGAPGAASPRKFDDSYEVSQPTAEQ